MLLKQTSSNEDGIQRSASLRIVYGLCCSSLNSDGYILKYRSSTFQSSNYRRLSRRCSIFQQAHDKNQSLRYSLERPLWVGTR
jgi:hypothetical protein